MQKCLCDLPKNLFIKKDFFIFGQVLNDRRVETVLILLKECDDVIISSSTNSMYTKRTLCAVTLQALQNVITKVEIMECCKRNTLTKFAASILPSKINDSKNNYAK